MSRYKLRFKSLKKRKEKALIPFVVAGDPDYRTSLEIVKKIIDAGADVLELGFVFSEPVADGPTIQTAGIRALKSGANTDRNLDFVRKIREYDNEIPIGILIYSNLIYQRGIDRFYKEAYLAGIDSVLVADLPIEEASPYVRAARKHGVDAVFIVSPLTSNERVKKIVAHGSGFTYVVSRLGVTGARADVQKGTIALLKRLSPYATLPLCVGFGISTPLHVKQICKAGADGAIVGSALVKIIEKNINNKKKMLNAVSLYVKALKKATR